MPEFKVCVKKEPGAKLPLRATSEAAGYDLCSVAKVTIPAGGFVRVPTGISISMPVGLEAQIRPRSGLAVRHGVTVLNSPGTIDSDYRGEICVILINHGDQEFAIEPGMRIAQMVFSRIIAVNFAEVGDLEHTERGAGGFGSTGTD